MKEEGTYHLPEDADDLRKHAPALFAIQGKAEGFVVPDGYFDSLADNVIAVTNLPGAGEFPIDEKYFNALPDQVVALAMLPDKDGVTAPEGYFEIMENELHVHMALDNIKQDEGFAVPENYFGSLTDKIMAQTAMSDEQIHNDEVPEGYFEQLPDAVLARINNEEQPEQGRVIVFARYVKQYAKITAIAASVALLVGLVWFFTSNNDTAINKQVAGNEIQDSAAERVLNGYKAPIVNRQKKAAIAVQNPVKPEERIKPLTPEKVIMNRDEIIAHTDQMDESLVANFVMELQSGTGNSEVNEDMMQYILDENTSLDMIDPGNK